MLDFVSAHFVSPALCGLLLGKYVSAREKGVELQFDPACQLTRMPASITETELVSVIGNLLDNAVDATLKAPVPAPVELYISDRNQELLIEVADRGCGVDEAMKPHLFRQDSAVSRKARTTLWAQSTVLACFWWQAISTRRAAALR